MSKAYAAAEDTKNVVVAAVTEIYFCAMILTGSGSSFSFKSKAETFWILASDLSIMPSNSIFSFSASRTSSSNLKSLHSCIPFSHSFFTLSKSLP